jgi:AraC family transcriptional regulator
MQNKRIFNIFQAQQDWQSLVNLFLPTLLKQHIAMETTTSLPVIPEVLKYIQHHLSSDLSLEKLSKFSGYSPFHLHRMMKQELEEPVGSYIKRKRMESAAMLLGLTSYPCSTIKYMVGYQNDAAFSKAFQQVMGCSPREFRKQDFFQHTYTWLPKEYVSMDYKIVRLDDWQTISFPSICDYFDKSAFKSWLPVKEFLNHANISSGKLDYWGVVHECPNLTGKKDCRYDAALSLSGQKAPKEIFNTTYPGGKFAVFRFCAPHSYLKDISMAISHYLMHQTKLEFREGCSYMKYLDNPISHSGDYLLTEWYVPVQ